MSKKSFINKESITRNESIGREPGKQLKNQEKYWKSTSSIYMKNLHEMTWIYEKSTHWIYATKEKKNLNLHEKSKKKKCMLRLK